VSIILGVYFVFSPPTDLDWALVLEVGIERKYDLWGDEDFPKYLQRHLCSHFNVEPRDIDLDPHDPDLILRDGVKFMVDEAFLLSHYKTLPIAVEDAAQDYVSQRDDPT
jgi:hypothetical protein